MNWTRKTAKAVTLTLTTGILIGAGTITTEAAPVAGVSEIFGSAAVQKSEIETKTIKETVESINNNSFSTRSGVSLILSGLVSEKKTAVSDSDVALSAAKDGSTEETAAQDENKNEDSQAEDISKIGVANVTSYVYIRSAADVNSDYTGKLYPQCVATVTGEEGDWYQVQSGDVQGYIRKDLLIVGDQATIDAASRKVATVTTQTLNVRKEPSKDAKVLTLVPMTDDLTVVDDSTKDSGWVLVETSEGNGYVSTEFVDLSVSYKYAESKEAEIARIKAEEAEREAARRAAAARESSSRSKKKTSSGGGSSQSYAPASGSSGSSVVSFASQFLGNPYVYGGSSLTNGTDCSGFVMSVYANFGVGLPHSSSAMRSVGYGVDPSEMQPGDIVCYSGHVGIYAGGGNIINASNPSSGIKYTNAGYKRILAVRRIF